MFAPTLQLYRPAIEGIRDRIPSYVSVAMNDMLAALDRWEADEQKASVDGA